MPRPFTEHGPMMFTGSPISKGRPPRVTRAPVAGSSSRTEPGTEMPPTGSQCRALVWVHVPPTVVVLLATKRR